MVKLSAADLDVISHPIWTCDRSLGTIAAVNTAVLTSFGFDSSYWQNQPASRISVRMRESEGHSFSTIIHDCLGSAHELVCSTFQVEIGGEECTCVLGLFDPSLASKRTSDDYGGTELLERFKLATRAANAGVFEYDFVTGELAWDEVNRAMFGLAPGSIVSEESWRQALHPHDRERELRYLIHAAGNSDSYDTSFRIIRFDDGSVRFLKALGLIRRDKITGTPLKLVGLNWDITEQKTSEERLRRSEEMYRSIVDHQTSCICRFNNKGDLTFTNKSYVDTFGGESESCRNNCFVVLFPEFDNAGAASALRQLFEPGTVPFEKECCIEDDNIQKWWRWKFIPLSNPQGVVYEIQAIGEDVTKRKNLELRQELLNKIVRESQNEIYLFDPETLHFQFANRAALNNLGYSLDELLSLKITDLFHYPNEMALRVLLKTINEEDHERLQLKLRYQRKNGSYYDIDTAFQALEENSYLAIASDITEKLETEKKLMSTIIEKETLIKEIHHRVKNNLQLISSLIYIRQSGIEQPEVNNFLESLRQKIRSMALIHERLLQSKSLGQVQVRDYIGRMLYDLRASFLQEDIEFDLKTDLEDLSIDIDTGIYCALIINELVTNSIRNACLTRKGGVLEVSFRKTSGMYVLTVRDNREPSSKIQSGEDVDSFGDELLDVFVRQLRGTLDVVHSNGALFTIKFKGLR